MYYSLQLNVCDCLLLKCCVKFSLGDGRGRGGGAWVSFTVKSSLNAEYRFYFASGIFSESGARTFKQSLGGRNRVGIGLSYRSARLHAGGIDSFGSILGLLNRI